MIFWSKCSCVGGQLFLLQMSVQKIWIIDYEKEKKTPEISTLWLKSGIGLLQSSPIKYMELQSALTVDCSFRRKQKEKTQASCSL